MATIPNPYPILVSEVHIKTAVKQVRKERLMSKNLLVSHCYYQQSQKMAASTAAITFPGPCGLIPSRARPRTVPAPVKSRQQRQSATNIHISCRVSLQPVKAASGGVPLPPLDLTEENIELVLADARVELAQLFDDSVGITGQVALSEMDGPFVKISLKGRFWHTRAMVVARIGNYLKQRIPEILEVEIEDEKQLDDSPASF